MAHVAESPITLHGRGLALLGGGTAYEGLHVVTLYFAFTPNLPPSHCFKKPDSRLISPSTPGRDRSLAHPASSAAWSWMIRRLCTWYNQLMARRLNLSFYKYVYSNNFCRKSHQPPLPTGKLTLWERTTSYIMIKLAGYCRGTGGKGGQIVVAKSCWLSPTGTQTRYGSNIINHSDITFTAQHAPHHKSIRQAMTMTQPQPSTCTVLMAQKANTVHCTLHLSLPSPLPHTHSIWIFVHCIVNNRESTTLLQIAISPDIYGRRW